MTDKDESNSFAIGEKPPVPDLPDSEEELKKLLERGFTTLHSGTTTSRFGGYRPGMVGITPLIRKCPACNMKFRAQRREGCFGGNTIPAACPNCSFPDNVLRALSDVRSSF